MSNKPKHRGPAPKDDLFFGIKHIDQLKEAFKDLTYLYQRGYGENAASTIVCNRYRLNKRQAQALKRTACSVKDLSAIQQQEIQADILKGKIIAVDAFNLLITIESALAGAYLFKGHDQIFRDIAGIHGTYRKVEETFPAIHAIGKALVKHDVEKVIWFIDEPVSNSIRLKTWLTQFSIDNQWDWQIELVPDADRAIIESTAIAITSDHWIMASSSWYNLANDIVPHIPSANTVNFTDFDA